VNAHVRGDVVDRQHHPGDDRGEADRQPVAGHIADDERDEDDEGDEEDDHPDQEPPFDRDTAGEVQDRRDSVESRIKEFVRRGSAGDDVARPPEVRECVAHSGEPIIPEYREAHDGRDRQSPRPIPSPC